ncbi:MAG: hypothetical protein ACXWSD_12875, partial [Bdellovibrionota bacterium]
MPRISLLALASLGILATPALAETKAAPITKMEDFVAPSGFMLIDEEVSLNMKSLPLALMDEAVADFSRKNIGEATGDLKAACRFLKASQGAKMNEKAAAQMKVSADNLDLIAKEIRGGQIKTVASLKERLAQVAFYQSLAQRSIATSEWNHRMMKQAGYDLDASATALERSMAWSGKEQESDTEATVKNSHIVAAKLINGSGWRDAEVKAA